MREAYRRRELEITLARWCGKVTNSQKPRYDLADQLLEMFEHNNLFTERIQELELEVNRLEEQLHDSKTYRGYLDDI